MALRLRACSRVGVEEVNGKEGKGEGKKRNIHLNLTLNLLEVKEVKGDKWGESLYSFHQNLFPHHLEGK